MVKISEVNLLCYTIVYTCAIPYRYKISSHIYLIGKGLREHQKNKQMKDNNIL